MITQSSLLTRPQNNAFLNPIAPYVKNIETIKHGNGFGTTNGTQINIIKMLGNNGGCDVILTPHSGQNIIAGFSTKKSSISDWITSNGSNTTDIIIDHTTSGNSKTISILNPEHDQYIWFAIAVDGHLGVPTPNINDTYTLELSGNYTSPESLLLTSSKPIATPNGFFDNPVLIQPNESGNQYNAQFGECLEGSYYFTFSISAYISRFLTFTPNSFQNFGIIISSNKNELRTWILNGGTGTLTDGGSYQNSNELPLDIEVSITTSKTMYAVYYDPSNIGVNSCGNEKLFTIASSQETQSGGNNGTYANPFIISNNEYSSNTTSHTRSEGECIRGAVYYQFLACSNKILTLSVEESSLTNVGIGYSNNKDNLALFLLTGNHTYLLDYREEASPTTSFQLTPAFDYTYYAIVYDPSNIGVNSCSNSEYFKVTTSQLYCNGGGGGQDGTFNNPFIDHDYNGVIRTHREGNCNVGQVWFEYTNSCGNAPYTINAEAINSQNIGVAWSTDKQSLFEWLNNGGGSGGCGYFTGTNIYHDYQGNLYNYDENDHVWIRENDNYPFLLTEELPNYCGLTCGHFDNPINPSNSGYTDFSGKYYNNFGANSWSINLNVVAQTFNSYTELPQYVALDAGYFDPAMYDNPNWIDVNGNIYTNMGSNVWIGPDSTEYTSVESLPGYYGPGVGHFNGLNYYDGSWTEYKYNPENGLWELYQYQDFNYYSMNTLPDYCEPRIIDNVYTRVINGSFSETFSGYNIGTIYATIYFPSNIGQDQCYNYDTFRFGLERENCDQFSDTGNGPPGINTNPFILKNNDVISRIHSTGDCSRGTLFFQSLLCTTQFTLAVSTPLNVGIAWANDINALYTWISSNGSGDLTSYDGGSISPNSGNSISFIPSSQGLYFFAIFYEEFGNTCINLDQITITTTQMNCDGEENTIGTYESPLVIGNNDSVIIEKNIGNCFTGSTYVSMQICASESPTTFTLNQSNNDNPQVIFYSNYIDITKLMVDYYINGATTSWGGYYKEGYNLNVENTMTNLTTTILASQTQVTMYIAIVDKLLTGTPRCSRIGNITLTSSQYCPTINIGGTSDISGGARYDYDPYAPASVSKHGVALTKGDKGDNYYTNLIYSPTLVIDNASNYPTITCDNISVSLYVNDVKGVTSYKGTKNITNDIDIIYDKKVQYNGDIIDYAFIKPLPSKEILFDDISLYTGILKVTYDTSVGKFTRNQVINSGDSFTNGRKQFAYLLSQNNEKLNILLPVADEDVHSLATENTCLSPNFTKNSGNIFQTNTLVTLSGGDSLSFPFKINNDLGYKNAYIHIPKNIVSSINVIISGGSEGISGGSGTISGGSGDISGGSEGISGGSGTISGGSGGISGVLELFKPKTIFIGDGIYPDITTLSFYDSDATYTGYSCVSNMNEGSTPYEAFYSFSATTGNTYVTFNISAGPGPIGSSVEGQYLNFTKTTTLGHSSESFIIPGWSFATAKEARSVPYTIRWTRTDPSTIIPDIKYLSTNTVFLWAKREYLYYNNNSKSSIILEKSTNPAIGTLSGSIDTKFTVDRVRVEYYNRHNQYMLIFIDDLEGRNYFTKSIGIDIPYNSPPYYYKNYQTNTIPIMINNIQYSKGLILKIWVGTTYIESDAIVQGEALFKNLALS